MNVDNDPAASPYVHLNCFLWHVVIRWSDRLPCMSSVLEVMWRREDQTINSEGGLVSSPQPHTFERERKVEPVAGTAKGFYRKGLGLAFLRC